MYQGSSVKAVKSLREEGYHIEAGPNKGYMLAKDTNRLSQEGIRLFLDDPKVKIDIYDELESTNQTAKKEAMMGEAGHGAFVIARSQTAGRGAQRPGILFSCRYRSLHECDPEATGNHT